MRCDTTTRLPVMFSHLIKILRKWHSQQQDGYYLLNKTGQDFFWKTEDETLRNAYFTVITVTALPTIELDVWKRVKSGSPVANLDIWREIKVRLYCCKFQRMKKVKSDFPFANLDVWKRVKPGSSFANLNVWKRVKPCFLVANVNKYTINALHNFLPGILHCALSGAHYRTTTMKKKIHE